MSVSHTYPGVNAVLQRTHLTALSVPLSTVVHSVVQSHLSITLKSITSRDKTNLLGILWHEWGLQNIWNAAIFKYSKNSYHSLVQNLVLSSVQKDLEWQGITSFSGKVRTQVKQSLYLTSFLVIFIKISSLSMKSPFRKIEIFELRKFALPVLHSSFKLLHRKIWLLWWLTFLALRRPPS